MNQSDREFTLRKIRNQYMEKEPDGLEALKALDLEVKRPVNILAYTVGALSSLIMGAGMSLVMTELGASLGMAAPLVPGIVIGIVGLAIAIANYPLYKKLLAGRKKQYAPRILAVSDALMEKEG